jgi:hypothetical protein
MCLENATSFVDFEKAVMHSSPYKMHFFRPYPSWPTFPVAVKGYPISPTFLYNTIYRTIKNWNHEFKSLAFFSSTEDYLSDEFDQRYNMLTDFKFLKMPDITITCKVVAFYCCIGFKPFESSRTRWTRS